MAARTCAGAASPRGSSASPRPARPRGLGASFARGVHPFHWGHLPPGVQLAARPGPAASGTRQCPSSTPRSKQIEPRTSRVSQRRQVVPLHPDGGLFPFSNYSFCPFYLPPPHITSCFPNGECWKKVVKRDLLEEPSATCTSSPFQIRTSSR